MMLIGALLLTLLADGTIRWEGKGLPTDSVIIFQELENHFIDLYTGLPTTTKWWHEIGRTHDETRSTFKRDDIPPTCYIVASYGGPWALVSNEVCQ